MHPWQSEIIYTSGDAYFADLLQAINSAKISILFEVYIFNPDQLGQRILQALGEAAKRHVPVVLRTDGVGSLLWISQLATEAKQLKINFEVYHPLPSLLKPSSFTKRFGRLNRRNHRKMCVIDSRLAFVGSMNVDACHVHEFSGDKAWRDTGLRVEGNHVEMLEMAFKTLKDDNYKLDELVKLNNSLFKRRKYYTALMTRVKLAKTRIWITSPYFNPPPFLIGNLCRAVKRGVDVCLLLGNKQDHFLLQWVKTYHYSYLLKNEVRIFEFNATILHAKTKIIDDWMTIGSSNQNYRSFFHDLEVDVVLTGDSPKEDMQHQFLKDLESSRQLDLTHWKKRSFVHAIIEKILSIFHFWI